MTETQKWITNIDDEGIVTFPDELLAKMGWKEGDTIDFDIKPDGTIFLTKRHSDGTEDGKVKLDPTDGN